MNCHWRNLWQTAYTVIDVGVSRDGTWMKHSYLSQFGLASVISCETGEVLEFEVMTKHCS